MYMSSVYDTIKNPETNRMVSIHSKKGQTVLRNYTERSKPSKRSKRSERSKPSKQSGGALPLVLILGGSANGNPDAFRKGSARGSSRTVVYAGLEEHHENTDEPCRTHFVRCEPHPGGYSNNLDIQGDWNEPRFWAALKKFIKGEQFDIIQFPSETAKFLPGGSSIPGHVDTPEAAAFIATNIYDIMAHNGLLYIDYLPLCGSVSSPVQFVKNPFSKSLIHRALAAAGFHPPVGYPAEDTFINHVTPKHIKHVKKVSPKYPLVHRSQTPQGYTGTTLAVAVAQYPLSGPKEFMIVMQK